MARATITQPPPRFDIPDAFSMSATQIARVFGISRQAIVKWKCPRNEDKTFDLVAVVAWYGDKLADELEQALGSGRDSQAAERYRSLKADMAELDLAVKRGTLIPLEVLRGDLSSCAAIIRKACETLEREHGQEAHNVMIEALDDMEKKLTKTMKKDAKTPDK